MSDTAPPAAPTTEIEMSPTVGELAKALAKAQGTMRPAKKEHTNPFFKSSYADLADCWDASRQPLADNGLAVVQSTECDPAGKLVIVTLLLHASGQWVRGRYPVNPVKADPQSTGAALTYARRYAFTAMVGVVTEDEDYDGNAAAGRPAQRGQPSEKQRRAALETVIEKIETATTLDALKAVWVEHKGLLRAVMSVNDSLAAALTNAKERRKEALEQATPAPSPPATNGKATPDLAMMQRCHALIAVATHKKSWRDALTAVGATVPEQFEEPQNVRDFTLMCEWVPLAAVQKIIALCERHQATTKGQTAGAK